MEYVFGMGGKKERREEKKRICMYSAAHALYIAVEIWPLWRRYKFGF
jgi:hypothetical protein